MDTDQIPSIVGLLSFCIAICSGLAYHYWTQAYAHQGGERLDPRRQGYGAKPQTKQA